MVHDPDRSDAGEWLTAAECAARTGLTVRALRVYEEYGLIAPRRSGGGWRQYGPDDLIRLNTIAMLKTAGLSLAQIRDVSRSGSQAPSLQQVLAIQLTTWKDRLNEAARGQAIVQLALDRLSAHHALSVDELCNLIRSFEMSQTMPTPASTTAEIDDVILEAHVLDRYVGFYAAYGGEFGFYTVVRNDRRLIAEHSGQPPFELYATSETEFGIKVTDANITFVLGPDGDAQSLVLRQHGVEITALRIDAAAAEQMRARLSARIEQKTPVPGSEAALRRLIESIRAGAPNYDEMGPGLALLMRRQLPRLQPIASYLGEIRSIEFQGVGGQGWDVYDVHRERGSGRWRVALGSDGKILGAMAILTSPVSLGP
jgi:DNA-binding transcriptional MerR regulator